MASCSSPSVRTKVQTQEVDINDVFDDILFSEEKVLEQGYREGFAIGSSEDNIEGYHLGYHRGAEIGFEVGYYQAFAEHYLEHVQESKILEKIVKTIETLKQGCDDFPRTNSASFDIVESIEKLRGLYKKVCTQLKVKTDFKKEGISF